MGLKSPASGGGSARSFSAETILRFVQLVQLSTSLLLVTHTSFAGSPHSLDRRDVFQVLDVSAPRFDVIITGIDAHVGETVLLPCTVRQLGDKVVSWIRTQDLSILTSSAFTFSADSRFESVHNPMADFWGLRIRGVRLTDAGQYECQVNTDPKMNLAVNLSIMENKWNDVISQSPPSLYYASRAQIKSAREVFVRSGSTLVLTCEVTPFGESHKERTTTPYYGNVDEQQHSDLLTRKARVRWLHEAKEISSKFDGGGVSVETDYRRGRISSRLILNAVQAHHSGRYTCTRQSTKEDTIKLHVTEVEHVEAMQRDSAYTSRGNRSQLCLIMLSFSSFPGFFYYFFVT